MLSHGLRALLVHGNVVTRPTPTSGLTTTHHARPLCAATGQGPDSSGESTRDDLEPPLQQQNDHKPRRSRRNTSSSSSSSNHNSSSRISQSSQPTNSAHKPRQELYHGDEGEFADIQQTVPAVAALDHARQLQQQVQNALAAASAATPDQPQQQQQQRGPGNTQQAAPELSSASSSSSQLQQQQQPRQQAHGNQGVGGGYRQQRPQQQQKQGHRPQSQQQHGHWQQQEGGPRQQIRQQQQYRQQHQEQPLLLFQGGQSATAAAADSAASAAEPDAAAIAGMLTGKLSAAATVPELVNITSRHLNALTPVHVAAAISRAAKLVNTSGSTGQPQQQQQQQHFSNSQLLPWLDQLLARFMGQMRSAGPTELSCVVGGLARLGVSGAKSNIINDVTLACLDASLAVLGDEQQLDNKLLLQLAWGAARLSVMPPVVWLQAFEAVSIQRMHTLNNIETANLVWVFAKWGVTPSPTWLAAFSAQLQAQLLSLQPPELCSVMWAAAMMQLQLPNPVMDVLLLEAQVKFVGFNGQAFGTLAWSLARMDVKPKPLWLQDFLRHSQGQLPALSTAARDQPFTNIIWALACWEHVPPKPWLQEFCRCVIPQLARMPTHSLAILAVSLAELKHTPAQEFTSYTLELFHQRGLAAAAAAAGSNAAAGSRDASVSGGSGAGSASSSSSSSKAGKASSLTSQTASFIWALPKLLLGRPQTYQGTTAAAANQKQQQGQQQQQQRHRHQQGQQQQQQGQHQDVSSVVSKAWMRQYCWLLQDLADVMLPGLERLSPTELVDVAAGLAGLGFFPGVPWMDAHEAALNRQLDALSDTQLAIIKAAYGTLEEAQQQQAAVLHPERYNVLLKQQTAAGLLMGHSSAGGSNGSSLSAAATVAIAASSNGSGSSEQQDRQLQRWRQQQQQQQQQGDGYAAIGDLPQWVADAEAYASSRGASAGSSGSRLDKRSRTGRLKGRPNKGLVAARRREAQDTIVQQTLDELQGNSQYSSQYSSSSGSSQYNSSSGSSQYNSSSGSSQYNSSSKGNDGSGDGALNIAGGYIADQGSGFAAAFEAAGWDYDRGLESLVGPKRNPDAPKQKPPKSRASRIRLQKIREQELQERQQRGLQQQQLGEQLERQRLQQQRQQERERGPYEGTSSEPQWSWVRDSEF